MSTGCIIQETGVFMPERWDPERYEQRAKEWRDRAAGLPEGRERDACVTIAEGYEKLAILTAPRSMIGSREKPAST
jgi:hypothetical protein